jgi:pSer/pThr/pTyr-binding forkhead associated (FHA) protein
LLAEDSGLVDEFGQLIYEAGTESGVQFTIPPRVKISADASMEPGRFDVAAQFSLQEVEDTSTLMMSSDDGYPLPEYAFLIINGVQIFPVNQQVINLGRRIDNHVVIEDLRVSRVHAQIRAIKGHFVIFDLDSSGGTFVNGVRSAQTTLYPGDVISLAGVDLVYGQDATYLSSDDGGSTQPLVPFPGVDD